MKNNLSDQKYPIGITPHDTWNFQDSSKISCFQACPRKYFFVYVLGLSSTSVNHDLIFGSSWHEAMEIILQLYAKNNNSYRIDFVEPAIRGFNKIYREEFDELSDLDFNKNPGRAMLALAEYMKEYPDDNFNVLSTEQYFKVFLSNEHLLVGKLDASIENEKGEIEILEHKTTKWSAGVWAEQWSNKIQINNYALIAYVLYEKFKGIIINGAKFFPVKNKFERIYIRKGVNALEDALTTVTYWMDLIKMNFELLSECMPESNSLKAFPRNGESCIAYSRVCKFKEICDNCHNPILEYNLTLLHRNFEESWWNPIEDNKNIKELTI